MVPIRDMLPPLKLAFIKGTNQLMSRIVLFVAFPCSMGKHSEMLVFEHLTFFLSLLDILPSSLFL